MLGERVTVAPVKSYVKQTQRRAGARGGTGLLYLLASLAHFARVCKSGYAAAGGSICP
jgi:hypothetical protein